MAPLAKKVPDPLLRMFTCPNSSSIYHCPKVWPCIQWKAMNNYTWKFHRSRIKNCFRGQCMFYFHSFKELKTIFFQNNTDSQLSSFPHDLFSNNFGNHDSLEQTKQGPLRCSPEMYYSYWRLPNIIAVREAHF